MERVHVLDGECMDGDGSCTGWRETCTGWKCLCIEWRGLMYLMEKVHILDEEGSYICWRGSM
jgi:hypothetical protein